jgi:predicted RNase H-like HicB family nuclease
MRDEITLLVERDGESGWLVASWDAPGDGGGITTQGQDLRELQENIREAIRCHFGTAELPRAIRLHFVSDPVLTPA